MTPWAKLPERDFRFGASQPFEIAQPEPYENEITHAAHASAVFSAVDYPFRVVPTTASRTDRLSAAD